MVQKPGESEFEYQTLTLDVPGKSEALAKLIACM